AALKSITDFQAKRPVLANIPYLVGPKLELLIQTKKLDEAVKMGTDVMARAVKQDDPMALQTVSAACRNPPARENKERVALPTKAAEAGLKISGDKDARALLTVAQAYHAAGESAKAKEYGSKAVAAAAGESERMRTFIEQQVQSFDKK